MCPREQQVPRGTRTVLCTHARCQGPHQGEFRNFLSHLLVQPGEKKTPSTSHPVCPHPPISLLATVEQPHHVTALLAFMDLLQHMPCNCKAKAAVGRRGVWAQWKSALPHIFLGTTSLAGPLGDIPRQLQRPPSW